MVSKNYLKSKKLISNYFHIENWYEERLALDQEYRLNPDARMVRLNFNLFSITFFSQLKKSTPS